MANQDDIRRNLIKRTRRDLMSTLNLFYALPASFYELRMTMPEVEEHYIKRDLAYLCEKGYVVRVDEEPNQRWSERQFKLTALGNETAEKINFDPAIEP